MVSARVRECEHYNAQKMKFSADLVTFTEEIHNGKLHFLFSVIRSDELEHVIFYKQILNSPIS